MMTLLKKMNSMKKMKILMKQQAILAKKSKIPISIDPVDDPTVITVVTTTVAVIGADYLPPPLELDFDATTVNPLCIV